MSEDVREFQRNHFNHLGHPLVVDGVLGSQTRWAMDLMGHDPRRIAVVKRALSTLGTREEPMGSNRGDDIDEWLRRCGIPVPAPGVWAPQNAWCAAAVSWWISLPGQQQVRLARVREFPDRFEEIGQQQVKPADLGFYLNQNGTGHIWLVTGCQGGVSMNVEGNTNNAVRVTTRPKARYLRLIDEPVMPGIVRGVRPAGQATR